MPTTILDGESYEQALHRRYAEEAAFDARLGDLAEQVECASVKTINCGHESCDCRGYCQKGGA